MKAWELLSDPTKFVKRAYAKNAKGNHVLPTSPDAVCFCMLGAVEHVYNEDRYTGPNCVKLRAYIVTNIVKDGFGSRKNSPEAINNECGREKVVEILKELDL